MAFCAEEGRDKGKDKEKAHSNIYPGILRGKREKGKREHNYNNNLFIWL